MSIGKSWNTPQTVKGGTPDKLKTAEQMASDEFKRVGAAHLADYKPNRLERRRTAATMRSNKWKKITAQVTAQVLRKSNDAHALIHNAYIQSIPDDTAWD